MAFTIILADVGQFEQVLGLFDSEMLDAALNGKTRDVHVRMPTFKTDSRSDIKMALLKAGAAAIFEFDADYSGMAGRPGDLLIQSISGSA